MKLPTRCASTDANSEVKGTATQLASRLGGAALSAWLGIDPRPDRFGRAAGRPAGGAEVLADDEREADLVGLDLAARAGYDPRAGVALWQKMGSLNKRQPIAFLSTHPSGADRIAQINSHLDVLLPLYARAKGTALRNCRRTAAARCRTRMGWQAAANAFVPLPTLRGVGPSYLWLPPGRWDGMLAFLVERFPEVSEAAWRDRMARGQVVDGVGAPLAPDSAVAPARASGTTANSTTKRRFHSRSGCCSRTNLVVVDKPHFLPMAPAGRFLHETLLVRLKNSLGMPDLVPIHRLDRETAGVVLFSANVASRGAYQSMFQQRRIGKMYEALAAPLAHLDYPHVHRSRMVEADEFFRMREVEGEPNSETIVEMIACAESWRCTACARTPAASTSFACIWRRWGRRSSTTPSTRSRSLARATISRARCSCWRARSGSSIRSPARSASSTANGAWKATPSSR